MQDGLRTGLLLGLGNPLLDISAQVDDAFLNKYEMIPNNAILAEEKHKNLCTELVKEYNASYTAGGSCQNTLRVAQWILEKPQVTTFFGTVGKDKFSKILEDKAREDGVNVIYQYVEDKPTGTCGVLLTGNDRSLCADLAAAECFTVDHIQKPENKKLIEAAQYFYITGFFLTVSPASIQEVAKHALAHGKTFIMNLSAPFLCQFFKKPMLDALPYVDVLFGNETEGETFAKEHNFGTSDLKEIALKLSALPKQNEQKKRMVVITQGHKPILVAHDGSVQEFPVIHLPDEQIVDTNGAGDAFVGGFLAQYVQAQPLDTCVRCGVWTATEIIKRSGCTYEGRAGFKP